MRRTLALVALLAGGGALAHSHGAWASKLMDEASRWQVRPELARVMPVRARPPVALAAITPVTPVAPAPVNAPAVVASAVAREAPDTLRPAAAAPVAAVSAAAVSEPEAPRGASEGEGDEEGAAEPLPVRGPQLVATHKEAWVYAAPSFKARKLGYLRAGERVGRGERAVGHGGCEGGWYRVEPRGYVCVGAAASLDLDHPAATLVARRPDRQKGLPYLYGMSRFPTPPFYLKLPSAQEQRSVESDLAAHLRRQASSDAWMPSDLDAVPGGLMRGQVVPSLTPQQHGSGALFSGRAVPRSGFALVSQFEWEGRRWGLTTDFQIVPLDRMRLLRPSEFHGLQLADGGLPAAFNQARGARLYRRDAATGQMVDEGPLEHRQGVAIAGARELIGGVGFVPLRDGRYVRDNALLRLDPPREWPSFATEGKKWIDVSILRQTLVAYEGTRPVYATLVSTGADGLGDPEKTHSTVRGVFMIHTKHVTVTMDSDEAEDRFDLRDVPYVQYFEKGYALHAAYWHDDFGKPRSHGCINLHPTDAAWLFGWTGPEVPEGWHGALTLRGGTLVYIHP